VRPTYRLMAGAAVVGAIVGLAARRWPVVKDITNDRAQVLDPSAESAAAVQGPPHAPSLPEHDQTKHDATSAPTKPSRAEALQPLTRQLLIQRSVETSPSVYLTITSIIQGVALGLLAEKAIPHLSPLVIAQAIGVFAILVLLFHFYIVTTILLRWAPSVLDALVPFIVGAVEIPPTFYLGHTVRWSGSVAFLWLVGSLGLVSSRYSIPANGFRNVPEAEGALIRLLGQMLSVTVVSTILTAACSLLAWHYRPYQSCWAFVAPVITVMSVAAIATIMEYRVREVYSYYGIERTLFF
jgi:hypothetical protein